MVTAVDPASESFHVERFTLSTFTYKDALECAWHQLYCYAGKPFGVYIATAKYDYLTLEELKYDYRDPVERIKRMKRQAVLQDFALHHTAQFFMVEFHKPGSDLYVLRDQDRRMVGVSLWSHNSFASLIDKQVGRVGVWVVLKRWWYSARFAVSQWIDWLRIGESSMVNKRFYHFMHHGIAEHGAKWSTPEQLASLSEDEQRRSYYPMPLTSFCLMFQILPEYQRRGLGQKLMKESLDSIPHIKPEIDGKALPQQLNLWATDEGKGMYEKCGWVPAARWVHKDAGCEVPTTDMYIVRD